MFAFSGSVIIRGIREQSKHSAFVRLTSSLFLLHLCLSDGVAYAYAYVSFSLSLFFCVPPLIDASTVNRVQINCVLIKVILN